MSRAAPGPSPTGFTRLPCLGLGKIKVVLRQSQAQGVPTAPLTCVKTSRAAPPHCPDCSARSSAPSSTMPPRAQFTTCTPRRHLAKVLSFRSPAEGGL